MQQIQRVFFVLCCTAALHPALLAQSSRYQKAMEERIAQTDKVNTPEAYLDLANAFERIGDAEKTQWLPYYYAAYCRVMGGYMIGNGRMGGFADKTDPEADKASELLGKAEAISGENSETWCVRKMIVTLRMSADPMNRFQTMGQQAAEALEKARKLDPANPRVYLLEGQDKFFTPEQFGGSKTEAKALFEQCLQKAESFTPVSSLHPSWGPAQARYFLSQIK
jgi:hypothetical protein